MATLPSEETAKQVGERHDRLLLKYKYKRTKSLSQKIRKQQRNFKYLQRTRPKKTTEKNDGCSKTTTARCSFQVKEQITALHRGVATIRNRQKRAVRMVREIVDAVTITPTI